MGRPAFYNIFFDCEVQENAVYEVALYIECSVSGPFLSMPLAPGGNDGRRVGRVIILLGFSKCAIPLFGLLGSEYALRIEQYRLIKLIRDACK